MYFMYLHSATFVVVERGVDADGIPINIIIYTYDDFEIHDTT